MAALDRGLTGRTIARNLHAVEDHGYVTADFPVSKAVAGALHRRTGIWFVSWVTYLPYLCQTTQTGPNPYLIRLNATNWAGVTSYEAIEPLT
jgi:hypothetical protein